LKRMNSDAVSPVVGVMLMLVVTIIIAAVVSAFAGGLGGGQQKTPQATIAAKVVIQGIEDTDTATWGPNYPSDFTAKNGIEFEHKGGDAFSLNDINIELQNQGITMIVTAGDELPARTCLPAGTTNGGYFQKIGNTTTSDNIISPGDKFMFYADNCYKSTTTDYLLWTFDTGYGYGPLKDLYTYSVIDKNTGGTITSGQFLLK
jgi:archaeal type IV pilus assembly protein PilA